MSMLSPTEFDILSEFLSRVQVRDDAATEAQLRLQRRKFEQWCAAGLKPELFGREWDGRRGKKAAA